MDLGGRYLTVSEIKNAGFKKLGTNVKIHSRASIYGTQNITVGDNVRIDDYAVIVATGPLLIGNYVSIHNFCFLGSKYGIKLGNFVTLAPGVMIFSSSDDYSGQKLTGSIVPKKYSGGDSGMVELKKHVIVGAQSIILPGCVLGEGVAVGAMSLVNNSLVAWNIYAGIPIRKIKLRDKDILKLEQKLKII
jgi:dTDP-4-amino-4,6-dideoxy-D-glucose acyltransferase